MFCRVQETVLNSGHYFEVRKARTCGQHLMPVSTADDSSVQGGRTVGSSVLGRVQGGHCEADGHKLEQHMHDKDASLNVNEFRAHP